MNTIEELTNTLYRLLKEGADQLQVAAFIGSLTTEQAALVAINARQKRLEMEKEFDALIAPLKQAVSEIEVRFLAEMNASGETNKSGAGWRATVSTTNNATLPDAGAFYGWLAQSGRYDMLQRRLSSKVVTDYLDEHQALPPGIALNAERKITFYRK